MSDGDIDVGGDDSSPLEQRRKRRRRKGDSDDYPSSQDPQPTKRTLNRCGQCNHTWYPKGRDVAVRCPECGSTQVKAEGQAAGGCGTTVLLLVLIAALAFLIR